ncbi:MAG: HAMP domain-containing histidine kinase [Clostridia bacterium]|nr:HAMP domain-containing histidine kinase [Clostridia bacterium]
MFKSVFGKYITAMTLIVVVSFVLLSSLAGSIVNNYVVQESREETRHVADLARKLVLYGFEESEYDVLEDYVNSRQDLGISLDSLLSERGNFGILATDENYKELICMDNFKEEAQTLLSDHDLWDKMSEAFEKGEVYEEYDDVGKLLREGNMIYAEPIVREDGSRIGTVLVFDSNENARLVVSTTTQTVVMACLWVMIAMLIAVYFISERLVDRIRTMNDAAKEYAKGKLDVRIEVAGQDEIAELSKSFNCMAEELGQLEEKRNQFISDVSHELRSPMMSILGFVDGVRTGSVPPEKQSYYLDLAAGEIKRLSRLVADLLDMSRLEMGEKKMNFERVDVCDVTRTVIVSLDRRIEEKNLDVSFDTDEDEMFVWADADAIHRVIYNLCENAIKFSYQDAVFRVTIRKEHDGLALEVYNEGNGISAEDLPNIFDRFYKSDKSRGLDKKGVGLGLYLVKTIITAHDAVITADSEEGKYCRFTVRFPKIDR